MTEQDSSKAKAVGVAEMEAEHQLMHDLLNQLQSTLTAGRKEDTVELLGRFKDVANLHFMEEQSLMRLHNYMGYAEHQQEHDDLIGELEGLSGRITSGEYSDATKAAESLEKWLMTHMNTTDAALETFLEEEGFRAP